MKFKKLETSSFISKEEIQKIVLKLARQIEHDYEGKNPVFIVPLKGSVIFACDLMREISLPLSLDFVHLYSPKDEGVRILKDITMDIKDRHVLIIEEIIDVGRTLSFLKERLQASEPASVKIVTFLDKPFRRELPIKPDYIGKTIDDRYVVGYGMDSGELCRNYDSISTFKQ